MAKSFPSSETETGKLWKNLADCTVEWLNEILNDWIFLISSEKSSVIVDGLSLEIDVAFKRSIFFVCRLIVSWKIWKF
jgi:hypothetical protein